MVEIKYQRWQDMAVSDLATTDQPEEVGKEKVKPWRA
jgi:hypothetical protein